MARGGFEPPKALGRQIYSLLRLTAPQPRHANRLASTGAGHPAAGALRPPARSRALGAGEGIRTPDRLITNQLLYQTELRQPDKTAVLAHYVPSRKPQTTHARSTARHGDANRLSGTLTAGNQPGPEPLHRRRRGTTPTSGAPRPTREITTPWPPAAAAPRTAPRPRRPTRSGCPRARQWGCARRGRTVRGRGAAAPRPRPRRRRPWDRQVHPGILLGAVAGETDRPHARGLQFLEGAGDVDDGGDADVRQRTGRGLRRRTFEPGRMPRLPHDPVHAGGIGRSQDGARRSAGPRCRRARPATPAPRHWPPSSPASMPRARLRPSLRRRLPDERRLARPARCPRCRRLNGHAAAQGGAHDLRQPRVQGRQEASMRRALGRMQRREPLRPDANPRHAPRLEGRVHGFRP